MFIDFWRIFFLFIISTSSTFMLLITLFESHCFCFQVAFNACYTFFPSLLLLQVPFLYRQRFLIHISYKCAYKKLKSFNFCCFNFLVINLSIIDLSLFSLSLFDEKRNTKITHYKNLLFIFFV